MYIYIEDGESYFLMKCKNWHKTLFCFFLTIACCPNAKAVACPIIYP